MTLRSMAAALNDHPELGWALHHDPDSPETAALPSSAQSLVRIVHVLASEANVLDGGVLSALVDAVRTYADETNAAEDYARGLAAKARPVTRIPIDRLPQDDDQD